MSSVELSKGQQTLTISLRSNPDLLKLVVAEMKYSCYRTLFFSPSRPDQHDQIFLKLNRMTYWLARVIHTLTAIKKKKKGEKKRKKAERLLGQSRKKLFCV